MERQLADDTPDPEHLPVPVETTASVDVQRDGRQLSAHDTDRLESDAMFVRKRRRKQRAGLHGDAQPWLLLEHPLLEDAFQGQARVSDFDLRTHIETKLADHLQPLRRSDEHTSELQSPCNLVCRLLLE